MIGCYAALPANPEFCRKPLTLSTQASRRREQQGSTGTATATRPLPRPRAEPPDPGPAGELGVEGIARDDRAALHGLSGGRRLVERGHELDGPAHLVEADRHRLAELQSGKQFGELDGVAAP